MRFLFECVGCYTLSSPCMEDEQSMPPLAKSEETRSLVAATVAAPEVGRRRKKTSPRAHAADWRPSLFAIAEDNNNAISKPVAGNLRHRGAVAAAVVAKRSVQRCGSSLGGGGGGGVGASRSHTRDYRHDHVPIVVPAFSAPFLF